MQNTLLFFTFYVLFALLIYGCSPNAEKVTAKEYDEVLNQYTQAQIDTTQLRLPDKFTAKCDKAGLLNVYDKASNKLVYSVDLSKYAFSDYENISCWESPTSRYLSVESSDWSKHIIIDLENKVVINIPIDAEFSLTWMSNDSLALIYALKGGYVGKKPLMDLYLWRLPGTDIERIGDQELPKLFCSQDGKHLYYFGSNLATEESSSIESLYLYEDRSWVEIFSSSGFIDEDSIRWLSGDILIFIGRYTSWQAMWAPYDKTVAYKVNYKSKKEQRIELSQQYIREHAWSPDNNYIYYPHGNNDYYKVRVDFGEEKSE